MKTYIIYKATCIETDMTYIGYTNSNKGFNRRKYEHYNNTFNGDSTKFYNALRKYPDKFIWEVLVESIETVEEAKLYEIDFIEKYDSYNKGYNSTKGGDGGDLSLYRGEHKRIIEDSVVEDIIQLYISGIGKAEIRRKYPTLSICLITSILSRNNIEYIVPINQRNKKEKIIKELHQSYTGENNGRFVKVDEDIKHECVKLYTSREMSKIQICKYFNIGGRVLDRIFKEFGVEKNKPIKC